MTITEQMNCPKPKPRKVFAIVETKLDKRLMPYTIAYTPEGAKQSLYDVCRIKDWPTAQSYGYEVQCVGVL